MKKEKKQEIKSWYLLKKVVGEVLYSALFLATVSIFYFFILISVKPQSFPFLTNKIEIYINNTLPDKSEISISKISVDLDNIYQLNVILEGVDLSLTKKTLSFPKITAQFSILDLITNQRPQKIKFEGAKIKLNNEIDTSNSVSKEKEKTYQEQQAQYLKQIWDIFLFLKNNKIITKNFEVSNIELEFRDKNNNQRNLIIESSHLNISEKNNNLIISTKNIVNLHNGNTAIRFNTNCQFNKNISLKCGTEFLNIVPESFSELFKGLDFLSKIQTKLGAKIDLEIDKNYELLSLIINVNSNKGSFHYNQFFIDKIDFKDLSATFELENSIQNIKLSKLKVTFDDDIKFNMSMNIKNFHDPNLEETEMYFRISNSQGDKIAKFWPIFLAPNIKDWIKSHIDQGLIKDAYANIKFKRTNNIDKLQYINSQILFSQLKLKYSDDMPEISNIDGIASFSKDDMKIDIISGDVLESKIKSGTITIDNFHQKKIILNINGIATGPGYDPLKHASYNSTFSKELPKYINGYADSSFDIKLPIKNDLTLKDAYIKVLSNIKDIKSDYLKDDSFVNVSLLKKFNDNNFDTYIDLSNAKIDLPIAGITKERQTPSKITLGITAENGELNLKNINLEIGEKNIRANISINTDKAYVSRALIQNNLHNNYTLYYEENQKQSLRNLEINGNYLDLEYLIKNLPKEGITTKNNTKFNNFIIKSSLKRVKLANNQYLENLNIDINCQDTLCLNGLIRSEMEDDNFLYVDLFQNSKKDNFTTIKANISDISLLAKGFNISDQINGGNTSITAKILRDKYQNKSIKGGLKITKGFSITKNNIVQTIEKEKIFEKVKNKIAGSKRINFNNLALNFEIKNNAIEINNLIAGSHLIGFTSKGTISLAGDNIILKGLIIPGYSLNKLFGIGDIPVLGKVIMGEKGGGLFSASYRYVKNKDNKDGKFSVNAASALAPGLTREIFKIFD